MAVFMARGYKGPFHTHVAQSLANYFSDQTKAKIRSIIADTDDPNADALLELLESETVTAWGAKSGKNKDRELYDQMSVGDWFLMRTARPNEIKYLQQVDLLVGAETPADIREEISEVIWDAPDYDLLWFSETPVVTTEMTQDEFETMIGDVRSGFELTDWFPGQGRNFARIEDDILDDFDGQEAFLNRIADHGGRKLTPGVDNYFLLNTAENAVDVPAEHRFDFKQTTTELSDEILAAENNGKVLLCDGDGIFATGRIGNIEGKQRDDGIHKIVTILDWNSIPPIPYNEILGELSVSVKGPLDAVEQPVSESDRLEPAPFPITRITESDYQTVLEWDPPEPDAYFILKTGSEEYEDDPAKEYHFKKGIPGSKQLRDAAGSARFVYLEDKEFYATGYVADLREETRDGTTHYFAQVADYEDIEPVAFDAVKEQLDPSFPIQYGIIKIPREDYEFIRTGVEPEFESIDAYESLSAARESIQDRLDRLHADPLTWLETDLVESVIDDWTTAIDEWAEDRSVTPGQVVKFTQLRTLFETSQSELRELSDQLQNGSVGSLSAVETLFLVLLMRLQATNAGTVSIDHERLHRILTEDYEIADSESEGSDRSGPLLEYLDSNPTVDVHRFTAPPEYWVTSVATGAISFGDDEQGNHDDITVGDVILFYCQETDIYMEGEFDHGFIGGGVVRQLATKPASDPWWWDEFNKDESFPYLVTFDELYFTGHVDDLVGPNPVHSETSPGDLVTAMAAITANLLPLAAAERICEESTGRGIAVSGTFSTFQDKSGSVHARPKALLRAMGDDLNSVPPIDMHRSFTGTVDTRSVIEGLHFEDNRGVSLVDQIESALRAGKHIIFTGPPGTGKTELARRVASYLAEAYPTLFTGQQMTTATADWSTFDTVGGYMPDGADAESSDLEFSPGIVLTRFKRRQPETQRNEPLIIDELNRADIDKAFGQLFTVLSGQSVQLPQRKDGHEVSLLSTADLTGAPNSHEYVVPNSWRIFATMNTYDKTSLYEMSYAFMRRFAFIRVGVPPLPDDPDELDALMQRYIAVWDELDVDEADRRAIGEVWRATNSAVEERAIGPAIVEDMLRYCTEASGQLSYRVTDAVISFVFPQLEGVPKRREILDAIAEVADVRTAALDRAGREMLQIEPLDNA